jgi:N-acylglucosamine 2-epimerase
MDQKATDNLRRFYEEQLSQNILPFWLEKAIDPEFGGYFTCFTNTGEQLLNKDKYVWSQGRFVWVLSKLAELTGDMNYLNLAKSGLDFLSDHCFLPNGNSVFLLSREGEPKEQVTGQGYDTSIYVDCFVVLGFAKYAMIAKNQPALESALRVYDSIISRIDRGEFRTDPYPIPKGYKAHGIPMILLNTSQEMAAALAKFEHPRLESVNKRCSSYLKEILEIFLAPNGLVMEMVNPSLKQDDTVLGRYVNPGHSIEDMWFIIHQAIKIGDQQIINGAVSVIEKMFEIGWDNEFGGLFLYVDKDGGKPHGSDTGFSDTTMLNKLKSDWNNKLWWVHSEALYCTLLGYRLTGKESLFNLYQKTHDYTFATFPNSNSKIGEWIQIRSRSGQPVQKIVALPVKDPFHIARNFILTIELLKNGTI